MGTGFNGYRDIDRAVILPLHSLTQSHANVTEKFHSLAVDEKFKLLAGNISTDTEVLD